MSLWEEPVRDVRPLAKAERNQLVVLLSELSDEEWLTTTAAAPWTVKDIALHLLDDDFTWLSMRRDGDMSGLLDMSDRQIFPQLLAAKNQRWVAGARALSRQLVTDLLRWTGVQLDTLHASEDLLSEGWVSWASDASVPFWFNLAQEFTERWVHQQQIREAVGRFGEHGTALSDVLRTFIWAFPHQLDAAIPASQLEIEIIDVDVWTLTADEARRWSIRRAAAGSPDGRLRLTADAAWRMLTGSAVPAGGLTTEGSPQVVQALTSVRAIIA